MISVCLASYNGEKYIEKQLESILPQLSYDDEVIISDDGSSDKTIEKIKKIKDKRVKLYINNGHNYTKNFENAIRKAQGDIIFLSDQDDIWKPNKVSEVMKAFKEQNCDFIVTDATVIDENKNVIMKSYFHDLKIKKGFLNNWLKTRYIGSCMAFKAKILKKALPIPGNTKYIAHDYWFACIAELYYKVYLLKEPLMYYVRHKGVASPGISGKSNISIWERFFKRIYILIYLFTRIFK